MSVSVAFPNLEESAGCSPRRPEGHEGAWKTTQLLVLLFFVAFVVNGLRCPPLAPASPPSAALQELPQHPLQDAAVPVVVQLDGRVEPDDGREDGLFAGGVPGGNRDGPAGREP
jgi:hypothetical protein